MKSSKEGVVPAMSHNMEYNSPTTTKLGLWSSVVLTMILLPQ